MINYDTLIKKKYEEKDLEEKKRDDAQVELDKIHSDWDSDKAPYEKEIAKIDKQYEKTRAPYAKIVDESQDRMYKIPFEIRDFERKRDIAKVTKIGKHNVDSFKALAHLHNIGDGLITEKTSLKNDVQIFRIYEESDFTMWLAFKGLTLVGVSYRRAGEHPGDQTYPFSFIDGLLDKNRLQYKKKIEYRYADKVEYQDAPATYTEWVKALEKARFFKGIPLTKNNLLSLGDKKSYSADGKVSDNWRY